MYLLYRSLSCTYLALSGLAYALYPEDNFIIFIGDPQRIVQFFILDTLLLLAPRFYRFDLLVHHVAVLVYLGAAWWALPHEFADICMTSMVTEGVSSLNVFRQGYPLLINVWRVLYVCVVRWGVYAWLWLGYAAPRTIPLFLSVPTVGFFLAYDLYILKASVSNVVTLAQTWYRTSEQRGTLDDKGVSGKIVEKTCRSVPKLVEKTKEASTMLVEKTKHFSKEASNSGASLINKTAHQWASWCHSTNV